MSGQLTIKWLEKTINDYFNNLLKTDEYSYVFYVDTDSAVIRLDKLIDKVMPDETDTKKIIKFLEDVCNTKLNAHIASKYQELADTMNAFEQKAHAKLDSISDRMIVLAKKKYVMNVWNVEGVMHDKPKLKMTGIQAIQSSTPQICKDKFKECFSIVMNGVESDLQNHVSSFRNKFNKLSFEEIAASSSVNDMAKYTKVNSQFVSGTPFHVKGAIVYNETIKKMNLTDKYDLITDGDKIKICYLKEPNIFMSPVIACLDNMPQEFNIDEYIDYNTQFEKKFLKPLRPIINTINWSEKKINTLDRYFT